MTKKYKMMGGRYTGLDGVEHRIGDVFTSPDDQLALKFAGSIVEYHEDIPAAAPAPDDKPKAKGRGRGKGKKGQATQTTAPVDVTADYPVAVANGLRVMSVGHDACHVYDGDDAEPITTEPVDTDAVDRVIDAYINGEE